MTPPTPPPESGPPRATFRPFERLRDPAAFRAAFERKRSASDAALVVHGIENGLPFARLGISIGKRKAKRAVDRNRVKRVIREVFRLTKSEWPVGVDYVVAPRDPKVTFDHARASLPTLAKATAKRLAAGPRPRSGS